VLSKTRQDHSKCLDISILFSVFYCSQRTSDGGAIYCLATIAFKITSKLIESYTTTKNAGVVYSETNTNDMDLVCLADCNSTNDTIAAQCLSKFVNQD
jgi:hypothetical protein